MVTLKAYEECTVPSRGGEIKLFLALIKLHKAVTSTCSIIAIWLKSLLEAADTVFTAHSVEGHRPQQL